MKFHKNKFLTTIAAVALALAVGACSSNGDDEMSDMDVAPPATTDPAPELTAAEQLTAAQGLVTAAQAMVTALTNSSTADDAAAAYAALGAAQTALHTASSLPENQIAAKQEVIDGLQADIDELQGDLDAANMVAMQAASVKAALATATTMVDGLTDDSDDAAVTAARDAVTAAQTALDATTDLPQDVSDNLGTLISSLNSRLSGVETARADRPTGEDIAAAAAATKAARTKTTAIATEAGTAAVDDAGLADTVTMTISRDRMGTTVKFVDSDLMGDDDPKFAQAMDLGGGRTMHVRTMDATDDGDVVEEVVVVSTDIAGPRAVAFAKFEDDEGMATQVLDVSTNTMNDEPDNTFEAFAIDENDADVRALVKSSAFTAGTVATLTFTDDDTDTNDMDEAFETAGTYNGALGTYRCNGAADCTVTLDAKGAITAMNDGWIFTPDPRATSDQPDYDYLHYGFWLMKTTDEDGVLTYDGVETFADSSVAESGNVTTVTGSATYDGGSTGVYVKNVYTIGGSIESATSGHFTADVSLMATFGQVDNEAGAGTIAPSLLNTLTGTIDNFDLSGGEYNEWAVNLQGDITESTGVVTDGTANGGGAEGSFNAVFHGSVAAVEDVVPKPSSVVGEFDANFSNGSVAGGFGARN